MSLGVVGVCILYNEAMTRSGELAGIEIGDGVKDKAGGTEIPARDRKAPGSSPTFTSSGTWGSSDLLRDDDL